MCSIFVTVFKAFAALRKSDSPLFFLELRQWIVYSILKRKEILKIHITSLFKAFDIENLGALNYLSNLKKISTRKWILRLNLSKLFFPCILDFFSACNESFCVSLFTFTVTRKPNSQRGLIQTEMHSSAHIPILKTEYCVKKVHFLLILLLIRQYEYMLGMETCIISKNSISAVWLLNLLEFVMCLWQCLATKHVLCMDLKTKNTDTVAKAWMAGNMRPEF